MVTNLLILTNILLLGLTCFFWKRSWQWYDTYKGLTADYDTLYDSNQELLAIITEIDNPNSYLILDDEHELEDLKSYTDLFGLNKKKKHTIH